MKINEFIAVMRPAARLGALALAFATVGCADDIDAPEGPEAEFRAGGEGGQSVEDPQDDPGDVIDEGPEGNAGVEGPVTITQNELAQLMSAGSVGATLQQQAGLGYQGDAITDDAQNKITQLTGEAIASSQQEGSEWTGTTANYRFQVDPSRDLLSIRHASKRFSDVPAAAFVPEAQILATATADLGTLGVALGEGQSLEVSHLMRASSEDPDNPDLAAYKVFVELELSGRPVLGPRLVLSYFGDGTLHKIAGHWPEIDSAGGPAALPGPGAILAAVYADLAAHPLGAETNPLSADAALTVQGTKLHQVVLVSGLLDNGEGTGQGRRGVLDVVF